MRALLSLLLFSTLAAAQGGRTGQPAAATRAGQAPAAAPGSPERAAFIRETYSKFEYRVPMRDGKKLFTSVYVPKDVFAEGKIYPILMQRTAYSVAPYGVDQYRRSVGPSELFEREKFIFAFQDVRGRFMSEGDFVTIRPLRTAPDGIDESTDAYDAVAWLIAHVPGNNGKVGIWGVSQPGYYATAALIGAHPAVVAVSPQAPVTDYYLGDDVYHNGAFMLAHRFGFYMGFRNREGDPAPPPRSLPFDYGTPDAYQFFLNLGPLSNANVKYFKGRQPMWDMNIGHPTYDEVWQSRSIWKRLESVKPAVLLVGGWYDTEDPQGLFRQFYFMEGHTPPPQTLVAGPWNHGGFARGDGDRLGNVNFGSKTAQYYRERIELPFFLYYLKGRGEGKFPKAWVFQTGMNQWRRFESWPPREALPAELFLDSGGKLSRKRPAETAFEEYFSDPNKPVPYIGKLSQRVLNTYMTEDQRFAATRPDVLVFQTEVLDHDVSVFGPITVDLLVSTTGTDSDFVVKVIDVFPNDYPDYNNPPPAPAPADGPPPASVAVSQMGGYQQLVRGEPFRGKFRKSFEKPVPFEPGKPDRVTFALPDIAHTWRAGHRIMVQIQSSWFPLTDRNPQKFVEIPKALPSDFQKVFQRVYCGGPNGSRIRFRAIE